MLNETGYNLRLIKRLAFLLVLYSFCRLLFLVFNYQLLSDPPFSAFIHGIRFDISTLAFLNLPYIALYLQPFRIRYKPVYQYLLGALFLITNTWGLFWNIVDLEYFKFTLKRTTWDVFTMTEDVKGLAGQFIADFWYLPLIFIALTIIFFLYFKKTRGSLIITPKHTLVKRVVIFLLGVGLTVFAARGGMQLKPLHIIHAGNLVPAQFIPLVLNTPFTLMKTYGESLVVPEIAQKIDPEFDPVIEFSDSTFRKKNIIYIILESFGKEYTSKGGADSFTPFLDSLIVQSLYFENAYANGKKSVEGIPAIIASIPSWTEVPFASSTYSTNKFNSIASVLKPLGYTSAFYHGARKGSMNLESFCLMAGYDAYKGLEDYPGPETDLDGHWGVFDGPYLDYFRNELNELQEPFHAAVFTLSSHHPYVVPDSLSKVLPKGRLQILQSVAYTDQALRQFMEDAKKESWYQNSVFVITADHTGPSSDSWYAGRVGMYSIPLLIFEPGKTSATISEITSQSDIFPLVLKYLGYEGSIFSLGRKTGSDGFVIQYNNGLFQIMDEQYVLLHDGRNATGFFDYLADPGFSKNLVSSKTAEMKKLEEALANRLTVYFNALTTNSMMP